MTADIAATPVPADSERDAPPTSPSRRRRMPRLRLPFSPWHLVLIPLTFLLVFPLLWMFITSLQTEGEANHFPPVLLPAHPRFENYSDAWATAPFGHFFLNSALVTLVVLVSNLVVCSLAGYACARIRFLGRGALFVILMATLMVPFQVTMIPVFLIVKWFG
ncbi:MAG: multiple sugar transport system permease protein, partial [Mycobacterium sp.]|nr:multiple sugar transport system permease protein [Mycobacterium sp.]